MDGEPSAAGGETDTPQPLEQKTLDQLARIFFPIARPGLDELLGGPNALVHYTSAVGAMGILDPSGPGIWFRSTRCMNDWSEVNGALARVTSIIRTDPGLNPGLKEAFNSCHPGLAEAIDSHFGSQLAQVTHGTFIACLSEHLPEEDGQGRLSMWRGYGGGDTGIALVLNKHALDGRSTKTGVVAAKAFYGSDNDLAEHFKGVLANVRENFEFLRTVPFEALKQTIYLMLVGAIVGTKHSGFREEREWRLAYLSGLLPSPVMQEQLVTVRDVPQAIFKLPFADRPDHGISGLSPAFLLERIIIGPSQFGDTIGRALASRLTALGIADPWTKIKLSNIPLRV